MRQEEAEIKFYELKELAEKHGYDVRFIPPKDWPEAYSEYRGMNAEAAHELHLKRLQSKVIEIKDYGDMRRALEDLRHELKEKYNMKKRHWHYKAAHEDAEKAQYLEFKEEWLV